MVGDATPGSEPLPKSFQSNTIVPNKSTLIEDDDDTAGWTMITMDEATPLLWMGSYRAGPARQPHWETGRKAFGRHTISGVVTTRKSRRVGRATQIKDQEVSRLREEQERAQVCWSSCLILHLTHTHTLSLCPFNSVVKTCSY